MLLASNWKLGNEGETCNDVCSKMGRICNMERQSLLNTNDLVQQKMLEAGHTCKGFREPSNIAGAPFSTNQIANDCTPIEKGTVSQCDTNEYMENRALCYCDIAEGI